MTITNDTQPITVLILEDEPLILMELAFAVEDEGARALTATNADRALAVIEDTQPDAAILDVKLGQGANCEPVAERLIALDVPFLLHSGDLMRQGELIARIGGQGVIPKPAASFDVARQVLALALDRRDGD